MDSSSTTVSPVQPAAGYQGGKRNLATRICSIIDQVPHDHFADVFVGMGGIFLRRRRRPRAESINDISGDIATFFRVVAEHHDYLVHMLRFRVAGRAEFARQLALLPEHLTDLQRAARFLYLQRLAFGGKVAQRHFGTNPAQGARFNPRGIEQLLERIATRLAGVTIEQLSFDQYIARYDRPGTLFYLDPPYWGCEDDYGQGVFARPDFERLAEQLAAIAGKFILSINDAPGARACFARFEVREVATTYTLVGRGSALRAGELLVSNFALPDPAVRA